MKSLGKINQRKAEELIEEYNNLHVNDSLYTSVNLGRYLDSYFREHGLSYGDDFMCPPFREGEIVKLTNKKVVSSKQIKSSSFFKNAIKQLENYFDVCGSGDNSEYTIYTRNLISPEDEIEIANICDKNYCQFDTGTDHVTIYPIHNSRQIKSSPNFKEFTADEIFDKFDIKGLTDTVFMDREECKNAECGMEEFTDLMWEVVPTWLGVRNSDDVREVCRRAKNPQAKAFLEVFETAMENAKFTDEFYNSVIVHKKRNVQSSKRNNMIKSDKQFRLIDTEHNDPKDGEDFTAEELKDYISENDEYFDNVGLDYTIVDLNTGEEMNISTFRLNSSFIKSSFPKTTKELADWVNNHTGWDVTYDEKNDMFICGPEDAQTYIEKGRVITDGDGWTEDYTVEEFMEIMNEGKINSSKQIQSGKDTRPVDDHMVNELVLIADNTAELYEQVITPVVKNLNKKVQKGIYDENKALISWEHVVDETAKYWDKKNGTGKGSLQMLSKGTRKEAAKRLMERYSDDVFEGTEVKSSINLIDDVNKIINGVKHIKDINEKSRILASKLNPDNYGCGTTRNLAKLINHFFKRGKLDSACGMGRIKSSFNYYDGFEDDVAFFAERYDGDDETDLVEWVAGKIEDDGHPTESPEEFESLENWVHRELKNQGYFKQPWQVNSSRQIKSAVDGGWEVDSSDVPEALDMWVEYVGEDNALEDIAQAMGDVTLKDNLDWIAQQWGIADEIEGGNVWDQYEQMREIMGVHELFQNLTQAAGYDELAEDLAFIFRMNDFQEWDER